jgi:predicted P-loop ATPase
MIAAVRRVRYPGSKFDEMAVWESAQGKNKSSALEVLAVRPEWFSDSLPLNADSKETIERVTGKLIIECADLHGLKRADVDQVKAQLSRQTDRARLAYGRLTTERPRQFVIFGTANSTDYLRDKTGNRRFWPVKVDRFDLAKLRADLDQLWGEAAFRESVGDATRLDPTLYGAATEAQAKRTDAKSDPYTDSLASVLGDSVGKITSEDVWKILGMTTPGQRTQVHNDRLGASMRFLGWTRKKVWTDGGGVNGYVKGKGRLPRLYVYGRPGGDSYVSTDPLEVTDTRDADP